MDEFNKNECFTLRLTPQGYQKIEHLDEFEVVRDVDKDYHEIILKHEPVKLKEGCEYIDIFTGKQYKRVDEKWVELI